ncbi:MAG: efflux RND transporter permease subunit [Pseudomonadota bacterium]
MNDSVLSLADGLDAKAAPPPWAQLCAAWLVRRAWLVVLLAVLVTGLAVNAARELSLATNLEALMPKGTPSVETLNRALEKTGSFASVDVVMRTSDPKAALRFAEDLRKQAEALDWVYSARYSEDISVFERHKLLYMETGALADLDQKVDGFIAQRMSAALEQALGQEVRIRLRRARPVDDAQAAKLKALLEPAIDSNGSADQNQRLFQSADGATTLLVVWPKDGRTGADVSKAMIVDMERLIARLVPQSYAPDMQVGVAGRIRNRVVQFDAVTADVTSSFIGSATLITLVLIVYFRSLSAIFYILPPLLLSVVWTMGVTAQVIGGLNLVTVFLGLILFGLGIDFGIHNLSRYMEARKDGLALEGAIAVVLGQTGIASLAAALTTAIGFLALMFTDFRAFAEFGFIAGVGVILAFVAMYTLFPALLVLCDSIPWLRPRLKQRPLRPRRWPLSPPPSIVFAVAGIVLAGAFYFALHIGFEKDFSNLEAEQPAQLRWATLEAERVFKGGHDRAVLVVDSLEEVAAIIAYFKDYVARDTASPTIAEVRSIYDFLPEAAAQQERLRLIKAIEQRLPKATPLVHKGWERYFDIGPLGVDDLPPAIQRLFLGVDGKPGYLIYIYNSVTMNDADLARAFYEDAARFTVNGKTYAPAAEAFVFVEMMALMEADAIKAILLVVLTTLPIVFAIFRSVRDSLIVFLPAAVGMLVTLGLMGALGIKLSIINMVILPSIIGIGVDNGIHIFHRFKEEGRGVSIAGVMATTGQAATLSTVTTLLGFAGMLTASMAGLRSLGLVASIGFSSCLLATWTLLPAVLRWQNERNAKLQS